MRKHAAALFALLFFFSPAVAQTDMPRIEGQSLAGNKVLLPEAARGKDAVLIFGFTHASKNPSSEWAKKIREDFGATPLQLYQVPVLEDVPHLIRGMVISGMKRGVPENQRDHFVIVVQSENQLKNFVGYKEPGDAYLVVLDPGGRVVEQLHGFPTPDAYSRLKAELESLLAPAHR